MYLTDAHKEYIKGTILMDNWRGKYDSVRYVVGKNPGHS